MRTNTILSVKEYSPLEVRGLYTLCVRTMLAGREDYARWSKGLYSFSSPPGIGERTVLSRATKRHFAAFETALCRRQNGTSQPSKRHFAGVETYFRQLSHYQ